ncbi:ABC transporter [Microtetraspora sp. NBRC 13810]|uniref:ABC transporter ATP-binding protein n=1 Tax=Microtetraspora sp. NBRC 13810 TaxID=3030990 RepID=UPI0024A0C8A8|nr:ABC transporter ATP-binding protein [Microtetraspora sp. NBRC 13810]GLW06421.1 ABC transporter [Microtetraspora sp. NBRC 13810]
MLEVSRLRKVYGADPQAAPAIEEVSFEVADREFLCILGSSGCGKSTLLKCLSGLIPASSGEIRLNGEPVTGPPEDMAFVFQDYSRSLLPWMTVAGNVSFPLRYKGLSKREAQAATDEALDAVSLAGMHKRFPWQLSGGMQQRVAIARALAYRPKILLMDEPFASLDAQTRSGLEDLLLDIWRRFEVTVLFITHDIDEAVYLADRVLVLEAPAKVGLDVTVPLPRPRDQLTTKALPEFAELRGRLFSAIQGAPVAR